MAELEDGTVVETQMAYDAVGRPVTTTYPDGATQSQSYDAAGQILSMTDARGNTTRFAYDAAGRRAQVTDALDQTTSFGYDAKGNQTSMTDARGHTTEFAYDTLGRLVTTTYPDGTTTEVGYGALGRRARETDQAGIATQFSYDALGRLTSVTDALDQVTSYTYDEVGNRLTQTDANGHTTSFEYDRRGRQVARILPDDARESMTYHADGTLASHTDFAGQIRTFKYDESQRLVRRAYPDGSEHRFSYTPTGQRQTATDARGVTSYAYDARDRLVEKQDPTGHRLTYTYDPQGNLASLAATVGTESYTTSYVYDALDRLVTITDPQDGVNSHTYDANGNRASLTHANGLVTTYDYDPLNRLTLLETRAGSSNAVQSYAYTLAPTGHRTRLAEADGTVRAYTYDALFRLIQDGVTNDAGSLVYQHDFAYDPVGNRLSQTIDEGEEPSSVISSAYDQRDRLLTAGPTVYGWDANGSLTGRDGDVFRWDFDQRLMSVTLEDGTVVETVYDVDGNRVQTGVTPPGGPSETVDYLVDTRGLLSHVVAEVIGGSVETVYVRSDDELVSLYRPAGEEIRFYHADGLGSIRALTDGAGEVTDRYAFEAFGTSVAQDSSTDQPYRFAGEYFSEESEFYYLRARWMQSSVGIFVSRDPWRGDLQNPPTLHRYIYALANPVSNTDPTGAFAVSVSIGLSSVGMLGPALLGAGSGTGLARDEERPLTPGETRMASSIFGVSVSYSDVRIARTKFVFFQPRNRAMAPRGKIHFHPEDTNYRDDFSIEGSLYLRGLFIHEMTHVWQYQNGQNVVISGILQRDYYYRLSSCEANFLDYGIEQQASIVEDYYRIGEGGRAYQTAEPPSQDVYRAVLPFINIKGGECAPISYPADRP